MCCGVSSGLCTSPKGTNLSSLMMHALLSDGGKGEGRSLLLQQFSHTAVSVVGFSVHVCLQAGINKSF